MIHHRQRTGQARGKSDKCAIRRRAKFHRASAKHLRARLELDVNFEADGGEIIHSNCRFPIADFTKSQFESGPT